MRALRRRLHRRRHPLRHALLECLLPIQDLDRAQVLARQRRDFDAIVRFAAAHSDFYASRFAGLLDRGDRPIAPQALPVLTRQDLVAHRDALLVRGAERGAVRLGYTGGSTGSPTAFWYDQAKHELMLAGMLRGFMMSGWRPGEKVLYLWGAARDVASGGVFGGRGRWLGSERTLAAVEFSEAQLAGWVRLIRRWRPRLLYGYASALAELARFLVDRRLDPPRGLRGAYSTAEPLDDGQRALIEQALGCKVFNQYGCREVPNIAWECRHGGMHVFTDMVYLESQPRDGGDRLLVSSLTNRLMPFIRYDLGDSGRLLAGECACGLPFPLMRMDMCRHNDLVRTPSGRRLHPSLFNGLLYGLTQIRQYQWRQTRPAQMALRVVAAERLTDEVVRGIEQRLHAASGGELALELVYVDRIPRTAAGKQRFVIGLGEQATAC
jgi:phenylacetate-CoA ligase